MRCVDEIHAFLHGQATNAPSAEVLCEWIQFCYALDLCHETSALLPYVRQGEVDPAIYKQARRISDACRR